MEEVLWVERVAFTACLCEPVFVRKLLLLDRRYALVDLVRKIARLFTERQIVIQCNETQKDIV